MSYVQEGLSYDFSALEPHIDAKTMEIHFSKHHAGYIAKLNAALEGNNISDQPVESLISNLNSLPSSIQGAVRNNGGGHANHRLFWTTLSPNGGGEPTEKLADDIIATFGSFDAFKTEFSNAAATRFGSGWAWLCVKSDKSLCVCSTANQDNPLMPGISDEKSTPILGLDVWEHAYYLNYQNRRPDYINAFFNVVNWTQVSKNYSRLV
jgi:superoxide dismutase, Fe-Mn family